MRRSGDPPAAARARRWPARGACACCRCRAGGGSWGSEGLGGWGDGVFGNWIAEAQRGASLITPTSHYSNTPILHHSMTPILHRPIHLLLHRDIAPDDPLQPAMLGAEQQRPVVIKRLGAALKGARAGVDGHAPAQ